MTDEYEPLGI